MPSSTPSAPEGADGPRVLFYAPGGGLGHLQRALALARRLRDQTRPVVLTTSPFGTSVGSEGLDVRVVTERGASALPALRAAFVEAACDALVADCFAEGPAGELVALEGFLPPRRALVLRRRADPAPVRAPSYELVLSVEAGAEAGAPAGARVVVTGPVLIRGLAELPSRSRARRLMGIEEGDARPVLLVLHHGYPGETEALGRLILAAAPGAAPGWCLRVASLRPLADPDLEAVRVRHWPAMELLPGVDAAVAGGGYASCHEVAAAGVPALHVPMGRRHDGQARRVRALGHGLAVTSPDELPAALANLVAGSRLPRAVSDPARWDGALRAASALAAWLRGRAGA